MKKNMPLEGLRWSRDSGSALYDTPQTAVLGRAGGGEWFGNVGICSTVQTLHLVFGGGHCRYQDDWDMAELDVLLDFLAEIIAAHSRHHHIAEDEARFFLPCRLQGTLGIETIDDAIG